MLTCFILGVVADDSSSLSKTFLEIAAVQVCFFKIHTEATSYFTFLKIVIYLIFLKCIFQNLLLVMHIYLKIQIF